MKMVTIVSLLGGSCLLTSTLSLAEDARTPPSKETEMSVELRTQAETRFSDLKTTADDQTRTGEERIGAILEMATLNLTNAVDYLFENISLQIPKDHFRGDDDKLKQRPCFYVLRNKGEATIPNVLRFLERRRNETDLMQVAKLLHAVMGTERATRFLQDKKQQTAGDSQSVELRTNIVQVISILSEERK